MKKLLLTILTLVSASSFSQDFRYDHDQFSDGYEEEISPRLSKIVNKFEESGVIVTCGSGTGYIDGFLAGYGDSPKEEMHYFTNNKGESCRVRFKSSAVVR
jgi:hypothetical protein